ncbi:MAG TPA: D-hexose-6-phosphate mutarotase [Phycisphaerae bacterium]|jgi:glucose-6-phosphate 1-epimerase
MNRIIIFPLALLAMALPRAFAAAPAPSVAPADTAKKLDSLNTKFALTTGTDHIHFITGEGGLICADIKTPACTGRVYLLGAHIAAWQPSGQEPVIFMSSKSPFEVGKAIRGGIPVCFPWFASKTDGPIASVMGTGGASPRPAPPSHGTVRTMEWQVEETKDLGNGGVSITLGTHSDDASKVYFPGDYELHEHITFSTQLNIQLDVKNTGKDPFQYEEALHAYLNVKDATKAKVLGLEGTDYIDKVDAKAQKKQSGPIFFTAETDRVYLNTQTPLTLADDSFGRKITVEKTDSHTTVIWNPGAAKTVTDLGTGQWANYVAIETANTGDAAITLKPGETRTMGVKIGVGK